jgi:carbonic anhydrase
MSASERREERARWTIPCTAPLNIVQNLQTDKICKLKCSYQFTYAQTTLQIANYGFMLHITPDLVSTPPVIYNSSNYNLDSAVLMQPSVHQYNGVKADAELILYHLPASGTGNALMVCVPIKASSSSTAATVNFFDMIMSTVSQTAASSGKRTIFNNSTFHFGRFVPMTPYYAYSGTHIFQQGCRSDQATIDYIVYHAENSITMSPQAFSTLQRVIPNPQPVGAAMPASSNSGGLFFNPNGPIPPNQPDIYIDCQPTGDDGEILAPAPRETGNLLANNPLKKLMDMNIIQQAIKVVIGLVLMVFFWKVMVKVVKGVTSSAVNVKPLPPVKK